MEITVGSTNPAKIGAVKDIFTDASFRTAEAPSGVSTQPYSDTETKRGAINRAIYCVERTTTSDIGIGLEGGVMYVDDNLYLCNWGALVTKGQQLYTASGARILLPPDIDEALRSGLELGHVMDDYASQKDVRKKEGAIGIFTNGYVSRRAMFTHVVELLYGQWQYDQN